MATTKLDLEMRVAALEELMGRATAFRFDVDLSEVDASDVDMSLPAVSRLHALYAVRSATEAWGIRRGDGSRYWEPVREDWVVGFHGIGSLDRVLTIIDHIMPAHRERVAAAARRRVAEERARLDRR